MKANHAGRADVRSGGDGSVVRVTHASESRRSRSGAGVGELAAGATRAKYTVRAVFVAVPGLSCRDSALLPPLALVVRYCAVSVSEGRGCRVC